MKKSLLKIVSAFVLTTSMVSQAHALDIVISPIFLLGSDSNDYPGVVTGTLVNTIKNSQNIVGLLISIALIPFAILNEQGEVVKPGVTIDNLLSQGYTLDEIKQFDRDQIRIFQAIGGKRMTVEQFKQILQNLNLAESSRQILGL